MTDTLTQRTRSSSGDAEIRRLVGGPAPPTPGP